MARQSLVTGTTCAATGGRSAVLVVGSTLVAAAAYPQCLAPAGSTSATTSAGDTLLGVVVAVSPLDDAYLTARQRIEPTTALALVGPNGVLASAGSQPAPGVLSSLATVALAASQSSTRSTSGQEMAAEPLDGPDGRPVAVLVASSSDQSVLAVRSRLERTLFLIALGGTVIALLFVAAIGERITGGLRRLTVVADRIRRGGTGERADITTEDEVGALGAAFDSMVASIEEQTAALQAAADDETRLRNRLQAVVAGMGDALIATDAEGRVTEFNGAAEVLTRVRRPEALGSDVAGVVDLVGEDGARLGPRLGRPDAWTALAALRYADETEVPVAVSAGVLRDAAGAPAGAVMVIRDLRREQELERMKSEFLSRVGHELRTPLTAIMGYAEILTTRAVSPAQSEGWHTEIFESSKRLARIVELLEFFASSGAGRVLLHPEPVDVGRLVREVAAAWTGRLGERHSLVKRVARATPEINVDRRWLLLALDELMDNALKFSPGGGRISLLAGPAPDGANVDITVADRGMGMTADEQTVAFGEFVQGDPSDTRRFGGLGLGLALVLQVTEGHGGSVLCHSTPGGGTRLTIRLPGAGNPGQGAGAAPSVVGGAAQPG